MGKQIKGKQIKFVRIVHGGALEVDTGKRTKFRVSGPPCETNTFRSVFQLPQRIIEYPEQREDGKWQLEMVLRLS